MTNFDAIRAGVDGARKRGHSDPILDDLEATLNEIKRLRAVILDIARIVENPDDRALQRVRDVTDKHSSVKETGTDRA